MIYIHNYAQLEERAKKLKQKLDATREIHVRTKKENFIEKTSSSQITIRLRFRLS